MTRCWPHIRQMKKICPYLWSFFMALRKEKCTPPFCHSQFCHICNSDETLSKKHAFFLNKNIDFKNWPLKWPWSDLCQNQVRWHHRLKLTIIDIYVQIDRENMCRMTNMRLLFLEAFVTFSYLLRHPSRKSCLKSMIFALMPYPS